ncbi:unnamed protein product [Rhizophagus irregularis]|nr:unnamed protein product [Rhizophagus irregularis]
MSATSSLFAIIPTPLVSAPLIITSTTNLTVDKKRDHLFDIDHALEISMKDFNDKWIKQPKAIRSLVEIEAAKNYSPPAITSAIKEYVTLELGRWKELETVKNARLNLWNRTDNDPDSPYFIEFILQRSFSKEELQIMDNVKFGITVILMLLDPIYDQPEVSSSKVQEHMGKWDSDAVIQKWLKGKTPLEDDNIMDSDMISRNYNDNNSEEQNTTESDLKNNLGETNETALAY